MNMKHLILSSGGPAFLNQLGALSLLVEKNVIEYEKIETIYACSSGALNAVLFCLNMDFKEIITYFIERPWEKLFNINLDKMINLYDSIGLFNLDNFKEMVNPLFKSKNINIDITFKDFFENNKKNICIFSTNHDTFNSTKFSHTHTPDVKLIEALYMSCTVPFLLKPLKYKDIYHIDGVYSARFPMKHFLQDNKDIELNEVFGLTLMSIKKLEKNEKKENEHNIFSFHMDIILKLMNKNNNKNTEEIQNINNICNLVVSGGYSLDDVYSVINNMEFRKEKIKEGYLQCNIFLMNKYNL
jgi:predicted acylesterase/phospholipase RssA